LIFLSFEIFSSLTVNSFIRFPNGLSKNT
jgi:hypothetical protein